MIEFIFKRLLMIIDSNVLKLVSHIEQQKEPTPYLIELIQHLSQTCSYKPLQFQNSSTQFKLYPVRDNYAEAINLLKEEQKFIDYWCEYGFVVGEHIVDSYSCQQVIQSIKGCMHYFNMSLDNKDSWLLDEQGTPILSRGFFEIYHNYAIAQLRQSIRYYLHYVALWQTPFLWTTFDRLGLKTPEGENAQGLPLHVDQNPCVHPEFTTIQGVLALEDCPVERGTFVAVPQSIHYFNHYQGFISQEYKGEYIALKENTDLFSLFESHKQYIPIKQGQLISWDSRLTHANSPNISQDNRYVAYLSTGIVKDDESIKKIRRDYFMSGLGINVREAYLHASKKPRFTSLKLNQIRKKEELNLLGQLLYGFIDYKDIL